MSNDDFPTGTEPVPHSDVKEVRNMTDQTEEGSETSESPKQEVSAPVSDQVPALNLKTDTRQADWRRANPEKYLAHVAVQRALSAGELVKGPCEVCGDPTVDGHHDDYAKPLAVRWLCRQHHIRLHGGGEDLFGAWETGPMGPE